MESVSLKAASLEAKCPGLPSSHCGPRPGWLPFIFVSDLGMEDMERPTAAKSVGRESSRCQWFPIDGSFGDNDTELQAPALALPAATVSPKVTKRTYQHQCDADKQALL